MSKSIKNLTNTNTAITVASVELASKAVAKAKTPAKQVHIFALDGVTRITAHDKAMLEGLRSDVIANSVASLAMGKQAVTMRARAASLWVIFGGSTVTSASLFAKLVTDGYLDAASVSGATAPSKKGSEANRAKCQLAWATNQAMFGTNKHPLFAALDANSPAAIAKREEAKVIASNAPKTVKSESVANLTDAAASVVATDTHVSAMVKTFMASKPTDLARKALLESVAKLLGFELEGFKSIKA